MVLPSVHISQELSGGCGSWGCCESQMEGWGLLIQVTTLAGALLVQNGVGVLPDVLKHVLAQSSPTQ